MTPVAPTKNGFVTGAPTAPVCASFVIFVPVAAAVSANVLAEAKLPAAALALSSATFAPNIEGFKAFKAAMPPNVPRPASNAVLFEAPASFAIPNAAVPISPAPTTAGKPNII